MRRVLVTGTDGFIGKNLTDLLAKTYQVFHLEADDLDKDDWKDDWKNILEDIFPTTIFHVGACSDTLEQDVNFMMQRNYETTKLLADWCFENNVPMIYSSSAANYGVNGNYPSNLYGWSKYIAENYVINRGGIALRYFNVYGPGESHKGRMASIACQMYEKNNDGKECKLFPESPRRDFVYVKDVISANIHAWKNFGSLNGVYYDVGCGNPRTFEDMLDLMEIKYSYHLPDTIPAGYQFYTCSSKEKWLPGWTPQFQLEEGIADYRISLERK